MKHMKDCWEIRELHEMEKVNLDLSLTILLCRSYHSLIIARIGFKNSIEVESILKIGPNDYRHTYVGSRETLTRI